MSKSAVVIVLQCVLVFSDVESTGQPFAYLNYTRLKREANDVECTLPPYPTNGKWTLLIGEAKPGEKLPKNGVVKFECNSGYHPSTEIVYRVCDKKWISQKFPECEELCPPLFSSDTFQLTCKHKSGREIECDEATHGSFVRYNCADFYEIPPNYSNILYCEEGKWNEKPVCQPVCGEKIVDDAKTLVFGSKPSEKLEYPWIAAIYQKLNGSYVQNCGGSILSTTIVLTAAHCVTNGYGNVLPKENLLVGAGKLYRKYQAIEDKQAQYREVSNIVVQENYKGESRRFIGDIAILVTEEEFLLNKVIQPVCFNNIKSIRLHPGKLGEISGWGRTEDELPSEVLRTLIIPYKYETTCAQELPSDWADRYNMEDKICAGFINQSTSVCDGDSGSGLAFKNRDGKYYIHGIVSLAHQTEGHCNIQQNALYTSVAYYYDFVDFLLTKYAPEVKDCKLPQHPENGKWTIEGREKKPGDAVLSSTPLKMDCDAGFILSSSRNVIECGSAHNMPTCRRMCPKLNFPKGITYECTDAKGHNVNCSQAVEGTKISYQCPRGFAFYPDAPLNVLCVNGSWGDDEPYCKRIENDCGVAQEGLPYPWHIGIYQFDNITEEYKYICAGTLVSESSILTAAHCVVDKSGKVLPKENLFMAAGQVYSKFNDTRDEHAQHLVVSHISVNRIYKGNSTYYFADIAFILGDFLFGINRYVKPVCLDDYSDIHLQPGTHGVVPGWGLNKGDTSEKIDALTVSYMHIGFCGNKDFIDRFTVDKRCTRATNHSACLSDISGNGFSVKNPVNGKYYIQGIVTEDVFGKEDCQKNVMLLDVSKYYNFISTELDYQYFVGL